MQLAPGWQPVYVASNSLEMKMKYFFHIPVHSNVFLLLCPVRNGLISHLFLPESPPLNNGDTKENYCNSPKPYCLTTSVSSNIIQFLYSCLSIKLCPSMLTVQKFFDILAYSD